MIARICCVFVLLHIQASPCSVHKHDLYVPSLFTGVLMLRLHCYRLFEGYGMLQLAFLFTATFNN